MTVEAVTPEQRPYAPRGAAVELLKCRDREVVLSGPAGTGKSRANLEKLYRAADKYPGMRGLILRQTRESLTETGLVTWEDKVVPERHPCLIGPQRQLRQHYTFPNGSEVIVGGLGDTKQTQRIMSSEYDMIFVQEATEVREGSWEDLTTRLRNGVMPYQQIIADCNPGPPTHWLKTRGARGLTTLIESRHEDNPVLWDMRGGKWTKRGAEYIAVLDALTGHRKLRLRYGKWAQAEGVVYPAWDAAVHVVDRGEANVQPSWDRWWAVDWGFTNPFVWQEWAEDPDGRLFLVREVYRTRTLVEDHCKRIKELTADGPRPRAVICDHDAEDRATFERHLGIKTQPAEKSVKAGIQDVEGRLRKAGDGQPRLFILRDALDAPDPDLLEAAKPTCTAAEFDGYVWRTGTAKQNEEPVKQDDHGLDALRYLCRHRANRPAGRAKDISHGGRSVLDDAPAGVFASDLV